MNKRSRDEEPHRYAKSATGEWVHALDANVSDEYYCDCPNPHRLKLVDSEFVHADKPKKRRQKEIPDAKTLKLAKQKLKELLPTLSFVMSECSECGWTERFRFNTPSEIDKEHYACYDQWSDNGKWQYGCLILNQVGIPLYTLEIEDPRNPSHEKMEETRQLDIGFAEFTTSDILQSTDASMTNLHILPILDCPQCNEEKRLKKTGKAVVGDKKKAIEHITKNEHWLHLDEVNPPLKQISITTFFSPR